MGEASHRIGEDALGTHFVGEDEVFDFICELDTKIERQQDFDHAEDNECKNILTSYLCLLIVSLT